MNTCARSSAGRAWLGRAVLLAAGVDLPLLLPTGVKAQPPGAGDLQTVEGRVREMTTAPLGEVDGAMLSDGTAIHWPPHLADRFTAIVAKDDRVRATGRMETGPAGDTHLEVQTVVNLRSKASAENDGPPPPPPPPPGRRGPAVGPPPPPPPAPLAGDLETVRGKVQRFTTAPRGETDGAVLGDGTVIHWPPHLADRFTDLISRGDRVRAKGRMETGPEGDTHLEVQEVTNMRTNESAQNDAGPPPPPAGPSRVAAPREGSRAQRLRDLEDQLDQIRRDIERLRREP
jgi:hypothetical protein